MKSMTIYEYLTTIQNIIWNIDKEKLSESIDATINLFDDDFPCSFYMILSQLIYSSFVSKVNDFDICLRFIQEIDKQKSTNKMFEIFTHYLIGLYSQESYYILMKLLEQNLINPKMIQNIQTLYFIHYQPYEINIENSLPFSVQFKDNIKELKENNWELHKKMVKEGINPLEIAKIIRNDEIEKLQEMTSQSKFDFNQIIKPSLYERFSFINDWNVTLIDYAAFFGSIKCFKYLLLNGSKINNTGKYAIAGGNEEIIHLCEQDHSSFYNAYETAIEFHRNDIFKYLYENNIVEIDDLEDLGGKCVLYSNFDLFYYLCEKGMKIKESIIKKSVKIGNLFLLKHFLKENVIQQSFLTLSVNSGNIELVKFILEQKDINVNAINNKYKTALMIAVENGNTEIVKLLLEQKGIDYNYTSKFKKITLLMIASWKGYDDIVKLFLEKDINVNIQDEEGETALMKAAEKGHIEVVKLLLARKDIDINEKDYFFGQTALMNASENGQIEVVKLLLEKENLDINAKDENGNSALLWAFIKKHFEIGKLLLTQKGIDITPKDYYKGQTVLIIAAQNGLVDIVKIILEKENIKVNAKDNAKETALFKASVNGNVEIVKLLLEQKGIKVNKENHEGWAPLMKASLNGHFEIVKLLLMQKGINFNAKTNNGKTAIMCASKYGHTEIVKLLLEQKGIEINPKRNNGCTALMIAAKYGKTDVIKLLLKQEGVDINNKRNNGDTALMIAAKYGNTEIVKLLLEQKGIDINVKNKNGQTALVLASENNRNEIVKCINEFNNDNK